MAPARVYTFDITLSDDTRRLDESFTLRLGRHPSETLEFLLARVLAYCLEFADGITVAGEVCQGDRPALEVRDFSGRLRTAVFVGSPAPDRLRAASRHAERVSVYTFGPTGDLRRSLERTRGAWASRVRLRSLEPGLLARLARLVSRRTRLAVAVGGSHLVVRLDGTNLDSPILEFAVAR